MESEARLIDVYYRDQNGDHPVKFDAPWAVHRMFQKLELKIIIEATPVFLMIYADWDGPLLMYHVPKEKLVLGVSQLVQMAYSLKNPE